MGVGEWKVTEGVARRVELLWGEGVCQKSGSVEVGVEELWSDEGVMVQTGIIWFWCKRRYVVCKLHGLHVLSRMVELACTRTSGHAISLHAFCVQFMWLG